MVSGRAPPRRIMEGVDFTSVMFSPYTLVALGVMIGFVWGVVFATVMHAARAPRTSRQNRNRP